MSLASDLLEVAGRLVLNAEGDTFQASLRRSLSTTYYAVFHLLAEEVVNLVCPSSPAGLRARVSRSLTHHEMNRVCGHFSKQLPPDLRPLLPAGVSPDLTLIAETFSQLQQVRHRADYDPDFKTIRSFALTRLDEASDAFAAWQKIRDTDEANVFLIALAFGARWSK